MHGSRRQIVTVFRSWRLMSWPIQAQTVGLFPSASRTRTLWQVSAVFRVVARDIDVPTDVLSFPIDPFPEDGMPGVQRLVGDIMLCVAVAQAQCADHAGSFLDELALLVTHSCLHICGYDHAEPNEREQMWNRERELIAKHWGSLAADPWS